MTAEPNAKDASAPGKASRRPLWFWLLMGLGVLVGVPVVLVAILLWALSTDAGTAWTLEQIPGLQTEQAQGSLLGQWQAEELGWQGYGVGVVVNTPHIDWSPSCLFRLTLCLEQLSAETLDVTLQPTAEEPSADTGPITLPDINLPIAVEIGNVDLGPFRLNDSAVWDRLQIRSQASGNSLTVERIEYRLGDIEASARGRVDMRRDWPLNLDVSASLPPPSGDQWQLDLNLTGSARDLRVVGTSEGYLEAQLAGEVQPLDSRLPAELSVTADRFLAYETLPETLTLQDWQLSLAGSLARGFRVQTRATLPGTTGPIDTRLSGLVTTQEATELSLSMNAPAEAATLDVNGSVAWAQGINADLGLDLDRFPWFALLPEMTEPPVTLEQLTGEVSYRDGDYTAGLQARVSGPLGAADLNTALEGDFESVTLSRFEMSTGAGSLTGNADLAFAGPLRWRTDLTLDQFNPGYWLPMLEARLNGTVTSEGQLQSEGLPVMNADWALEGRWRQQPASARGQVSSDGNGWRFDDLLLSVADNRIEGQGAAGERLSGVLDILLPEPDKILADLSGSLEATVSLAGTLEAPAGSLSIKANQLAWQDQVQLGGLQADATLTEGGTLSASVRGESLEAGGQQLETLSLGVEGGLAQHSVTLSAVHPEAELQLAFAGALDITEAVSWDGALTQGRIEVPEPGQIWQLEEQAALAYNRDGRVTFGAHCWRWEQSSVCADDQRLWPEPDLAYQIRRFPTRALEPLLPETFRWVAELNADINVALGDQGPDGQIRIDAGTGEFEFLVQGDWQSLGHDTLVLDARLRPDQAELELTLEGPELGQFRTAVAVDPVAPDRPMSGEFSLADLDLAFLSAFLGLEEVAGTVDGEGRLSGPLLKPDVRGELALTQGRFFDPSLPLPMEDVVVVLEFLGQAADISGRWKSDERGSGELSGRVDWSGEPEIALNIVGNRLPVTFEPYARLEIAPDLNIRFTQGELSVAGQVAVPRGDIEVRELPESAVSVSEDEVVVGVEQPQPAIRSMLMDITVVVGEDRLTFDAFGVTGDLEGTLRIGNNMDTRGALRLVDGRYEAFGQELELRRARIQFVGPLTEPYLDIEAIRTVDAVVAGIRLTGPVDEPETEVFSEPSMPQSDALSYVILGRPPQSQGDEGQMSQAALSLGLTQASKLTQGLGNELGIRNLTLEAEGSGQEASVVASGYITDELSLRYGVGIFEPITTVALRYDLGRYFYLEAASGLAASLDIFYTRNF
ncbi:MAG: translocation/assembly module TamB domain-containing protein [Pseudomonadota bacterium]|nr:translocation/assembly module TamB domain-containing protein [Pseudomonadota bacterium]